MRTKRYGLLDFLGFLIEFEATVALPPPWPGLAWPVLLASLVSVFILQYIATTTTQRTAGKFLSSLLYIEA